MTSNLETAIIAFLADEFKISPDHLNPDTSFTADFGLTPDEVQDLFQRLQDSLNIVLPEEKLITVNTITDLLELTREDIAAE